MDNSSLEPKNGTDGTEDGAGRGAEVLSAVANFLTYLKPSPKSVSPITLFAEWAVNKRLIGVTCLGFFGVLFNVFFTGTFFVAVTLRKPGNSFLCCLGITDLLSGGIVPLISAVVQVAKEGDTTYICHILQFMVTFANNAYMLLYLFVSFENYSNVAWTGRGYEVLNKKIIAIIITGIVLVSVVSAAVGTFMEMDYDYCSRRHNGNMLFRYATFIMFYAIPFVFTCFYLGYGIIRLHTRNREPLFNRSPQHKQEMSLIRINSFIYAIFILSWTPYLTAIYRYPDTTSEQNLYVYSWIGILRCIYTPFVFTVCNPAFRKAYIESFCYCFCRENFPATDQNINRHRRTMVRRHSSGDVCVHLMHNIVHPGSAQRAAVCACEGQEL